MRMQNANAAKKDRHSRASGNPSPLSLRAVGAAIFLFFSLIVPASAQTVPQPTIYVPDPTGGQTFEQLLQAITVWLNRIAGPILMIILIIGAIQMLTSQDNETKFAKGKKTVTYAVIGAAVLLVANGIYYVVQSLLTP